MARFRQIYLEITNVCNLRCAFCPGTTRPPQRMTPAQFAALLSQVKPLTFQIYLHVLGEPLLHPDFARLIELAGEAGVPVAVTTNGTLLGTPAADSLLGPGVRQVNISLHSLYGRTVGDEQRRRLAEILAFTRRAGERRPDLYLNYRLWNFASAEHSDETELNAWLSREIASGLNLPVPAVTAAAGCKTRRLCGRLYLDLDTRFEWPERIPGAPENERGTCHGMIDQLAILADGTVVPCCLDRNGVIALGNALTTPLATILDGPRARAMAAGLRAGKLVEPLCRQCTFRTRFKFKGAPVSGAGPVPPRNSEGETP